MGTASRASPSVLPGWAGWRRGTVRFDAPDPAFMPHKYNADRRHHIQRLKRRVTNWAVYNDALRQRGSLTMWFTDDAIAAWKAAPRTTPGGQAALLRPRNYDNPDTARSVPSGAAPDRGVDRLDPPSARPRPAGIGARQGQRSYFSTLSARSEPRAASTAPHHRRSDPPAGRQFGAEAGRPRRVAGREARYQQAALLAQTAHRV